MEWESYWMAIVMPFRRLGVINEQKLSTSNTAVAA